MIDRPYCGWFLLIYLIGGLLYLPYHFYLQFRRLVRAAVEDSNNAVPYYRMSLEIAVRLRGGLAPRISGYGPEVDSAIRKYLPKCRDLEAKQFLFLLIWGFSLFAMKWLLFSCGLCRTH